MLRDRDRDALWPDIRAVSIQPHHKTTQNVSTYLKQPCRSSRSHLSSLSADANSYYFFFQFFLLFFLVLFSSVLRSIILHEFLNTSILQFFNSSRILLLLYLQFSLQRCCTLRPLGQFPRNSCVPLRSRTSKMFSASWRYTCSFDPLA